MARRRNPADAPLDMLVDGGDTLDPTMPGILTVAGPGGTSTTYVTAQVDLFDALADQ